MLHEVQSVFLVYKCLEFFPINFIINALRVDEFGDNKLSFNIAVKLSFITSFL